MPETVKTLPFVLAIILGPALMLVPPPPVPLMLITPLFESMLILGPALIVIDPLKPFTVELGPPSATENRRSYLKELRIRYYFDQ